MSNLSKLEAIGVTIGAVGGVIGAISGLLTIPKAGREVWETYVGQPSVNMAKGSPLSITYNPTNKLLMFRSGLTFSNNGYTAEHLELAAVLFGMPDDANRQVRLDVDKTVCKKDGNKLPKIISVSEGDAESVECETAALLPEVEGVLFQHDTQRIFGVQFYGKKGNLYSVSFLFDTSQSVVSRLLGASGAPYSLNFLGSDIE